MASRKRNLNLNPKKEWRLSPYHYIIQEEMIISIKNHQIIEEIIKTYGMIKIHPQTKTAVSKALKDSLTVKTYNTEIQDRPKLTIKNSFNTPHSCLQFTAIKQNLLKKRLRSFEKSILLPQNAMKMGRCQAQEEFW